MGPQHALDVFSLSQFKGGGYGGLGGSGKETLDDLDLAQVAADSLCRVAVGDQSSTLVDHVGFQPCPALRFFQFLNHGNEAHHGPDHSEEAILDPDGLRQNHHRLTHLVSRDRLRVAGEFLSLAGGEKGAFQLF